MAAVVVVFQVSAACSVEFIVHLEGEALEFAVDASPGHDFSDRSLTTATADAADRAGQIALGVLPPLSHFSQNQKAITEMSNDSGTRVRNAVRTDWAQ